MRTLGAATTQRRAFGGAVSRLHSQVHDGVHSLDAQAQHVVAGTRLARLRTLLVNRRANLHLPRASAQCERGRARRAQQGGARALTGSLPSLMRGLMSSDLPTANATPPVTACVTLWMGTMSTESVGWRGAARPTA